MTNKSQAKFFWTWTVQRDAANFAVSRSDGCHLLLDDGKRVFDGISTNFQVAFGHSCTPVKDAIHRQLDAMPVANPKTVFELKSTVSSRLITFVDSGEGRIFYTLSGAEAIENALKMARHVTGRKLIAARSKSYHGATLGALSVTGDWRGKGHFGLQESTVRIPEPGDDPDLAQTRSIIEKVGAGNIAAMCLETISGMNGVIIPEIEWWRGIEKICRENGILLIVDEVSCGFGRTGTNLAMHRYGIQPDFVCMAKAISAGYVPFGALWVRETTAAYYDDHTLNSGLTAYAHPLGLAATNAVLNIMEDKAFQESLRALSSQFVNAAWSLRQNPRVKSVRATGLIAAIDLEPGRAITWQDGIAHGLHLAIKDSPSGSTMIVAPPLVMTPADCERLFESISSLLALKPTY